jgi:rubrerythrin
VGLWQRMRDLGGGSDKRRIIADLANAYREELRGALQLRLHAERVPYPNDAATLLGLAEREDAHAAAVRQQLEHLGAAPPSGDPGTPRGGHNYWERLTFDLEDLRAKSARYRELALHWDVEDAETAAVFDRLAHEDAALGRVIGNLIARSDPHAED